MAGNSNSGRRAAWREDAEFVAVAKRRWPHDVRMSTRKDLRSKYQAALWRLRERHAGFRAAKETST